MRITTATLKSEIITNLPLPEQTSEWPRQAIEEKFWTESTLRSSVLRIVYPEHPSPWILGAMAHINTGELKVAKTLRAHTRQQYSGMIA